MMVAAVRSTLIFGDKAAESGGRSWESDAIGGGFDTFNPHPESEMLMFSVYAGRI